MSNLKENEMRAYVEPEKEATYVEAKAKQGWRVTSRHPNSFMKCVVLYLIREPAGPETQT